MMLVQDNITSPRENTEMVTASSTPPVIDMNRKIWSTNFLELPNWTDDIHNLATRGFDPIKFMVFKSMPC
jgi:hypothetical protein